MTGASSQYLSNAYTWDYAGRLTSYGGKTYSYDAFGRTSATANGSTTRYIGMNGHTVGERNTTLGVATDYIFGSGIDVPLAKRTANGSISYFGVDGLGSVVVSTDLTGAVQSSTGYSPWGETLTSPAELFGYTGRETGGPSWYYRARYYDAARGRFLSEDPLSPSATVRAGMSRTTTPLEWSEVGAAMHLYAYASNSPVLFKDPYGLAHCLVVPIGTDSAYTPSGPPGQTYKGCIYIGLCGSLARQFIAAYRKPVPFGCPCPQFCLLPVDDVTGRQNGDARCFDFPYTPPMLYR